MGFQRQKKDFPPGQPSGRRDRTTFSLIQLLPNLMTLSAICCGMAAIRFGFEGRFELAVALILVAAILDGLDGQVARFLRSESLIGAELDSLADFLNFGVTPAMLVYAHSFQNETELGWIAALAYALACVLRLARFNVTSSLEMPPLPNGQFQGVPSPAGAGLALAPMYYSFLMGPAGALNEVAVAIYLVAVGACMISHVPTPSLKSIRLPKAWAGATLVGVIAMGLLLWLWPWASLLALCAAYIGLFAISVLRAVQAAQ